MKRYVLSIVLMTMFLSPAAFSQEAELLEQMELQMHRRNMELEMEERETDAKFHQEMRKLELEERRAHLERERRTHRHHKPLHPLLAVCLIVHILVAIWVYQDIRQRNRGSGIWVVVALLAGLFGVIAYAIVRLADNAKKNP